MKNFLKQKMRKWLEVPDKSQENLLPEPPKDLTAVILANRHYLMSVKPADADEYLEGLTEGDRRAYEAEASTVFNSKVFQREIKYLLGHQALFVANQASNWEQSLIGRGNVNGIGLILDRFQDLSSRHLENIRRPEAAVDKHGLMPE